MADETADDESGPDESGDGSETEQTEQTDEAGETEAGDTGDDADLEAAADGGDGPTPVGVKLGSTRTVVTLPDGEGGQRTVRTLTCLATYDDPLTGEERVLYGEEAATEYPDRVQFMLRSGLPEDEERADLATTYFRTLVEENEIPADSVVVYAVPTIDNERGLENLESVIEGSGIGDAAVRSYPESLCGAIPAGDDLSAVEDIFVAVNMGSTNLEACAYRRGEQLVPFTTGGVTGNEVDRRIVSYVEEETQGRVKVDRTTAREYKEEHADFDDYEPFTDVIQQPGGGAHEFTIERSVMDACDEYLDEVVEEVANSFLPEVANDHMKVYQLALDRPVVLTGGMACIPGIVDEFETRLSDRLEREVTARAPGRPDLAAARGAERIAERLIEADAY